MQIVKELVPTANPLKVLTYFELAAINAFREEFPEAELSGCYFHLSQSIVRKVGELGLKNQFQNDQNFNLLVLDVINALYGILQNFATLEVAIFEH